MKIFLLQKDGGFYGAGPKDNPSIRTYFVLPSLESAQALKEKMGLTEHKVVEFIQIDA